MTAEPKHRSQSAGARHSLFEAIRSLTSELSLDVVLQNVADLSRELVGASYSALGVLGTDGRLVQFVLLQGSARGSVTASVDPRKARAYWE